MTAELTLGELDLMGESWSPYTIRALKTDLGTDWGNPEAIETELRSYLQYGSLVFHDGIKNRVVVIVVAVGGVDMADTANAEAALMAELYKPNELTYTPPDAYGAPTVFDVLTSSLEAVSDDMREVLHAEVVYRIRLVCAPYVYSATETVTVALAASGSTTTLVDAMSATTNWTGTVNGVSTAPATAGGALSVTSSALAGTVTTTMTKTASITTSSTKYLVLDWKVSAGVSVDSFSATGDGVALMKITSAASPTAGYTRTTFYVAAASVAAVTFTVVTSMPGEGGQYPYQAVVRVLTLDNLDRTDIRPFIGTARQLLRTIEVAGSAPAIGSIAVEHASSALGDVLLYTCPDDTGIGYVPACRTYYVSGGGLAADVTNTVSGSYNVLDSVVTYDVPVAALPEGEYLVMVRALRTTGATVSFGWTHEPRMGGASLATATARATSVTLATTYGFHRLGWVHLPLWDANPGTTSVNRFTVVVQGDALVRLDDLYLLNMTTGRLTQVACGTAAPGAGGTSNRLWVDSPSLGNDGLGRVIRGYASDRSDAFSAYPALTSPGVHEFTPPSVKVFSVTTNPTTEASVSFRYRAAFHTHATHTETVGPVGYQGRL